MASTCLLRYVTHDEIGQTAAGNGLEYLFSLMILLVIHSKRLRVFGEHSRHLLNFYFLITCLLGGDTDTVN